MPKISFVIPIYNGETLIEKNLKKILDETDFNYELVLVDDGSTDNTKSIIETLALNNPKIQAHSVFHRGLLMCRNYALKYVSGDYICFMDIEDSISEDYLKILSSSHETNSDLYVFGYTLNLIDKGYKVLIKGINESYNLNTHDKALKSMLDLNLFESKYNKLYKKEILEDITFSDDYYKAEDLAFNSEVFKRCETITLLDDSLYIENIKDSELNSSKFVKNNNLVIKNKLDVLNQLGVDSSLFNNYMFNEYESFVVNLFNTKNYKSEDRIELIKESILNDVSRNFIINSKPNTTYSKLFRYSVKKNNPKLVHRIFKTLKGLNVDFVKNSLKSKGKII